MQSQPTHLASAASPMASFGFGASGYCLLQEQIESVITCPPAAISGFNARLAMPATLDYAGIKVPMVDASTLFDTDSDQTQIKAHVIAKHHHCLIALPFDGRCALVRNHKAPLPYTQLNLPELCRMFNFPPADFSSLTRHRREQLDKQRIELGDSDRYMFVRAADEIFAVHSQHIKHIMNTTRTQRMDFATGYFKGLACFLGKSFPLIDVSTLLGLKNSPSSSGQFTLLIELAGGTVGLTVDALIHQGPLGNPIHTGPGMPGSRYPQMVRSHSDWRGQRVTILDPLCLEQDPTITGLIEAGKRLGDQPMAGQRQKVTQQSMKDAVITVLASQLVSLSLSEVQSVIDLHSASEVHHEGNRIKIDAKSEWIKFYDLGALAFNAWPNVETCRYAIVMKLDDHQRIALGVSKLGGIHSTTWKTSVPKLGQNPPGGHGHKLDLVQIRDKALIRNITRQDLCAMVGHLQTDYAA